MNRLLIILTISFAIANLGSCKAVSSTLTSGEAIERVGTFWKLHNNVDTPYIVVSEKVWFQDSIGITQICRINSIVTDTGESTNIITAGYRFFDLKKKWAFEYTSFSDTATIMRKYRYTDATFFSGGWNFANRTPSAVDSFSYLPDTTINEIKYKQCKVSYLFNGSRFGAICLLRCDKKNTHFPIDTAISNKIGCPLVSILRYPINYPQSKISQEVKFVSNNLPDSIVKVFTAWRNNENTHPIE